MNYYLHNKVCLKLLYSYVLHKLPRFSSIAKITECLSTDYNLQHLNPNGRTSLIYSQKFMDPISLPEFNCKSDLKCLHVNVYIFL